MKKLFITFVLVLLVPSFALAADFMPTRLQLTLPEVVKYEFDGSALDIPINVSGTTARAWFFVFTKDKGDEVGELQNGYLGWHYVNSIDTCMYVSGQYEFDAGDGTITWDGLDNDGGSVPSGDYTYYVFAYDHINPPELNQAIPTGVAFQGGGLPSVCVKELGEDGLPLDQPVIFDRDNGIGMASKWAIGYDPLKPELLETTDLQISEDWTYQNPRPVVPKFDDWSTLYFCEANKDALILALRSATWVPNDLATRDTEWGFESGECFRNVQGPLDDNNYIYFGKSDVNSQENCSMFYILDHDAEFLSAFQNDIWMKPEEFKLGQELGVSIDLVGGPRYHSMKDGKSIIAEGSSRTIQLLGDPLRYLETLEYTDFILSYNQNGDYVADLNSEPDSATPWINFLNAAPFLRACYYDDNFFFVNCFQGGGAVSFALLAPDLTGVGHYTFAGETGDNARRSFFVQNGSAYDGWYVDGQSSDAGMGYVGHDSFKGLISSKVVVADAAPSAFAVEQNSPNPANPSTTISFTLPEAGNVTVDVFNVTGQKVDTLVNDFMDSGRHSVVWDGSNLSTGVYFYTITSGEFSKTMKMTLLK